MSLKDRFAWVLVAASALAAMVAGHALELWLEKAHVFGEQASSYRHVAQSAAAEGAVILFLFVAVAFARRLVDRISRRPCGADQVLPALSAIADAGFTRIAPLLGALQLTALVAAELGEQHLSGYHGNAFVAIAGSGHGTALIVHLVIALIATFVLVRVARFAAMRSDAFVEAVITFVRRALPAASAVVFADRKSLTAAGPYIHGSALLSLGLANRPPPGLATLA